MRVLRRAVAVGGLAGALLVAGSGAASAATVATTLTAQVSPDVTASGGISWGAVVTSPPPQGYGLSLQLSGSTVATLSDCASATYTSLQTSVTATTAPNLVAGTYLGYVAPGTYCARVAHGSQVIGADTYSAVASAAALLVVHSETVAVPTPLPVTASSPLPVAVANASASPVPVSLSTDVPIATSGTVDLGDEQYSGLLGSAALLVFFVSAFFVRSFRKGRT